MRISSIYLLLAPINHTELLPAVAFTELVTLGGFSGQPLSADIIMFAFEIRIYRIMTLIQVLQRNSSVDNVTAMSLFIAEFRDYNKLIIAYYHTTQLIHSLQDYYFQN
jgi:hypothetical protein